MKTWKLILSMLLVACGSGVEHIAQEECPCIDVGGQRDGGSECRVVESCAKPDCHNICGWVNR